MSTDLTPPKPAYVVPPGHEIDYSQIVTEDDTPLDSFYQEKQQRLLPTSLLASWSGPGEGRPWTVGANVGIFHTVKKPAVVPDVFVATDVQPGTDYSKKENRSYFIWEMGKPPVVVVEFVSNTEGNEDSEKLKLYYQIGVDVYVIFDPNQHLSNEILRVYERHPGKLRLTHERFFPDINLGVTVWYGDFEGVEADWLRWTDSAGDLLPTSYEVAATERQDRQIAEGLLAIEAKRSLVAQQQAAEQSELAETERQRADEERMRAEVEKQRADEERTRAEVEKQRADDERTRAEVEKQRANAATERANQLEAKLRSMGIET